MRRIARGLLLLVGLFFVLGGLWTAGLAVFGVENDLGTAGLIYVAVAYCLVGMLALVGWVFSRGRDGRRRDGTS